MFEGGSCGDGINSRGWDFSRGAKTPGGNQMVKVRPHRKAFPRHLASTSRLQRVQQASTGYDSYHGDLFLNNLPPGRGFFGQNWSKKNPQGRGSYLTKYGLTIYFLDPDHAPTTFWTPQEIPRKNTFLFLGRVANNKSGLVGSRFTGVAFTSESISSPSFLRTPKTVRNLP